MNTILVKNFFGFSVTVVVNEFVLSNGKTPEKSRDGPCKFLQYFIFFQSNDVSVVFDVVREFGWISEWVSGHDERYAKTDNTFNDPFSVRALIFKVRWKILRS